jgi:hypothetical protein
MTNRIIKQLLLSNIVIPRKQIGSWNIMTTNLIEFYHTIFDYIMPFKAKILYRKIYRLGVKLPK